MKHIFEALGTSAHRAWADVGFDEARLPAVAAKILRESGAHERFDLDAVSDWFFSDDFLPPQHAVPFAAPPLVAWQEQRFFVEVPFWVDGTTLIHDHGFSGAFQVLGGSSIHTWYEFEPEHRVKAGLVLGRLVQKGIEYLRPGDVREVAAGQRFIHSLFHIERPSVTLLIRTYADPDALDAFEYLPPNLRVREAAQDRLANRRQQMLDSLATVCGETTDFFGSSYGRAIARIVGSSDFAEAFHALRHLFGHAEALVNLGADEVCEAAIAVAAKRHGSRAHEIAPALREERRQLDFTRRRSEVRDLRHRVLLGALLNGVGRDQVLDVLAQCFGGDPRRTLRSCVDELVHVDDAGVHLLDLSIAAPAAAVPAVRSLVGATFSALVDTPGPTPPIAGVLRGVHRECPVEAARYARLTEDLVTHLRRSWSFRTLLPAQD
jgi:hypothetical protein